MKIINYCLLATALLSTSATAAFVNFGTGGARGHEFLITNGTRVTASADLATNRLRVGYLATPGLASSFVEFATTTINNPLSTVLIGGFVNVPTANNANAAALAAMKTSAVAIWVFGQGGQQGLFTSTAWTAPAAVTTEVDSSWDLILGVGTGGTPPVVVPVPIPGFSLATYAAPVSINFNNGTPNPSASRYTLGVVPEPTTSIFLALLGGVAVLRRKR